MLGADFFQPLATAAEIVAAGGSIDPALYVNMVQLLVLDGTIKVHLCDFEVQQSGPISMLSFSRDLFSRILSVINDHPLNCGQQLTLVSQWLHAHHKKAVPGHGT